ncbi:flagellar basal body rod protein FlgC [Oryzibacter oryziterrae]|uniref:flagellar basal body rod protein FlgC n=1 Tax=Oryzibacter oryziterrae TaxID=2766474 RepID=UPI001F004718|nr:flagellar basal body rod C-terminal domain-containing protein [Oryzibacter oryziterrae]
MLSALRAALSGINAATTRLDAAAANIANASDTGRVPDANGASSVYRPLDVSQSEAPGGGTVATVSQRSPGYSLQYQPNAPDADARGMVAAPDVSMEQEVSNVMMARVSYAANVKTMKAASDMQKSLMDTLF